MYKKSKRGVFFRRNKFYWCMAAVVCVPLLNSCKDDYPYDDSEPQWLGSNVYDYLQHDGHYTNYLRLIDDLGYKETLLRTGSKTLFPANDDAFAAYFREQNLSGNGIDIINSMSMSQKRVLFNSTMLNMAYLDNMLSNVWTTNDGDESGEGRAMVRESSSSYLDSIRFVASRNLPSSLYWNRFADRGGVYLVDNASRPDVFFTPMFMQKTEMTANDWAVISGGKPYETEGFYVNGVRVSASDKNITCKNGYLHIADGVVRPLNNMAEVIAENGNTNMFSYLMDKFSAPYYDKDIDNAVKAFYTDETIKDSVFIKRYFNDNSAGGCLKTPDEKEVGVANMLYFDPGYNTMSLPTDMGVMLVPTDEAMDEYWNSERGKFLKDVYGEWDNVPLDVLSKFIKNHQLKSFVGSMPHEWNNLSDQKGFLLNLKEEDIVKSTLACNGLVYQTNRVFPPIDYQCAYGPTLTSPVTKVMKLAIDDNDELKFHLYLRSLENQYNLLVPVDEAMKEYREPISWAIWATGGADKREIWSFKAVGEKIYADIYNVNADGSKGSLRQTIGATNDEQTRIMNRLNDILDMHIVVADNESEPFSGFMDSGTMKYALTKGGTLLGVKGKDEQTQIYGGGDVEVGLPDASVSNIYHTDNSHTFFIDRVLQDPFKSVYATLKDNSEYSEFFSLLLGDPIVFSYFQEDDDVMPIFDLSTTEQSSGIGQIVTSFNNYRYTVLVPTNEAVKQAFKEDSNLWTWERISIEDNPVIKKEKCLYLLNFLRYHFIDGAVPVSGVAFAKEYDTAARDENNQFVKIFVESSGTGLSFDGCSKVVTSDDSNYNILTRDYIVDNKDTQKANNILASSRAVIHLVNHVANYNKK